MHAWASKRDYCGNRPANLMNPERLVGRLMSQVHARLGDLRNEFAPHGGNLLVRGSGTCRAHVLDSTFGSLCELPPGTFTIAS